MNTPAWILEAQRLALPGNERALMAEIDSAPESARYPGILGKMSNWIGLRAPRCVTFISLCLRYGGVKEPPRAGDDLRCWGASVDAARVGAVAIWERAGEEFTGLIVTVTPGAEPLALCYCDYNDYGLVATLPVNDSSAIYRIPADHFVPRAPLPVMGAWGAMAMPPQSTSDQWAK